MRAQIALTRWVCAPRLAYTCIYARRIDVSGMFRGTRLSTATRSLRDTGNRERCAPAINRVALPRRQLASKIDEFHGWAGREACKRPGINNVTALAPQGKFRSRFN